MKMRESARRIAAVAAGLVITGTAEARAQDFEWQGAVDRGDAVTIRGVNGSITARATTANEVRVEARKEGDDDPNEVRIEVIEDARGVLVCAVYPTRRGRDPNRCGRGEDYRMSTRNHDVKVHFTVEVPAGVDLEARNVNGGVEALGIAGGVEARTTNGDIAVEGTGDVGARSTNGDIRIGDAAGISARTTNGDIEAALSSQPADDLSFRTVNGRIRLTLPAAVEADVEIRTVNGSIDTEFPLTIRGRWGPRSASGEIGGGGPEIELRTTNGSIALVRGG